MHLPHLPPIPIAKEMEVMKFWGGEIQKVWWRNKTRLGKKYNMFGEEIQNLWQINTNSFMKKYNKFGQEIQTVWWRTTTCLPNFGEEMK